MLPVSGAWQLMASGAITGDHPEISATAAYSRLDSPDVAGRKRFHSPSSTSLTFQLLDDGRMGVCVVLGTEGFVRRFGREYLFSHEVPHASTDLLSGRGQFEVHQYALACTACSGGDSAVAPRPAATSSMTELSATLTRSAPRFEPRRRSMASMASQPA